MRGCAIYHALFNPECTSRIWGSFLRFIETGFRNTLSHRHTDALCSPNLSRLVVYYRIARLNLACTGSLLPWSLWRHDVNVLFSLLSLGPHTRGGDPKVYVRYMLKLTQDRKLPHTCGGDPKVYTSYMLTHKLQHKLKTSHTGPICSLKYNTY